MRLLRRALLAGTAAGALAVTAAACGTASAPGGAGTPSSPAAAKVSLAFRGNGRPGVALVRRTLRCDPPGGTVRDAAAACQVLLRMRHNPFAPRPRRAICPMIMGAGGQIVVTGTWFGQPVHRVVMDGECDLALFGKLARILR